MATGLIQPPAASPAGSVTSDVLDNDGQFPTNILNGGAAFATRVSWTINKPLADTLNASHTWRVQVFADELGGPTDKLIGTAVVAGVVGQTAYPAVDVPCAKLVDNPPSGSSGLYRIATTVLLVNGTAPTQCGGFVENGVIQTF